MRLKELRIEKKMNQKELADKLGYKQNTISQWENDKRFMDTETLRTVANFFGVSTDYLLGESDIREELPNKKESITDELSENKKALLTFAETVPEDKAAMILQVMKSIVEAD